MNADTFTLLSYDWVVCIFLDAPNLRRISKHLNAYAVASPTLNGIQHVLEQIKMHSNINSSSGHPIKVYWVNLREEPVLYINAKHFVLRDSDHPFHNLQVYTGIGTYK